MSFKNYELCRDEDPCKKSIFAIMIISLGYIFRNFTVPKDMHLTYITYNIPLLYLATVQNSACQLMCPSARRESVFSSVFAQDTGTMPL